MLLAAVLALQPAMAAMAADVGHYVLGDTRAKTPGKVQPGLLLMGGGDRNFDAMRWFMQRAGNGLVDPFGQLRRRGAGRLGGYGGLHQVVRRRSAGLRRQVHGQRRSGKGNACGQRKKEGGCRLQQREAEWRERKRDMGVWGHVFSIQKYSHCDGRHIAWRRNRRDVARCLNAVAS